MSIIPVCKYSTRYNSFVFAAAAVVYCLVKYFDKKYTKYVSKGKNKIEEKNFKNVTIDFGGNDRYMCKCNPSRR